MALANLFGWMKAEDKPATAACGTECGAGEKPEEKPAACGTACATRRCPVSTLMIPFPIKGRILYCIQRAIYQLHTFIIYD